MLAARTITTRRLRAAWSWLYHYPPQRQPFFAGQRACLDMRADAGCPISVDIAGHSFSLALYDGVVRGGQGQFIEIRKSLEDGADGVACLLGYLSGLRHRWIAAEQSQIRVDNCLSRALAAQAATINLANNGN